MERQVVLEGWWDGLVVRGVEHEFSPSGEYERPIS